MNASKGDMVQRRVVSMGALSCFGAFCVGGVWVC